MNAILIIKVSLCFRFMQLDLHRVTGCPSDRDHQFLLPNLAPFLAPFSFLSSVSRDGSMLGVWVVASEVLLGFDVPELLLLLLCRLAKI